MMTVRSSDDSPRGLCEALEPRRLGTAWATDAAILLPIRSECLSRRRGPSHVPVSRSGFQMYHPGPSHDGARSRGQCHGESESRSGHGFPEPGSPRRRRPTRSPHCWSHESAAGRVGLATRRPSRLEARAGPARATPAEPGTGPGLSLLRVSLAGGCRGRSAAGLRLGPVGVIRNGPDLYSTITVRGRKFAGPGPGVAARDEASQNGRA